jgi:hypothetical protein
VKQALELIGDGRYWIHGLLGLVLVFYLGRALIARREQRRALFKLEQEQARTRFSGSMLILTITLFIIVAVFGSSTFLLPTLDPPPTLTVQPSTPTSTPLAPTATSVVPATATSAVTLTQEPALPTATPTSKPSHKIMPANTPATAAPACPDPSVRLTSLDVNQQCGYAHRGGARIQKSLLRLMAGRTSFVITHRLSTIRDADQILVIDNGKIVEQGTHQQLMGRRRFFYHLYASQFKRQQI